MGTVRESNRELGVVSAGFVGGTRVPPHQKRACGLYVIAVLQRLTALLRLGGAGTMAPRKRPPWNRGQDRITAGEITKNSWRTEVSRRVMAGAVSCVRSQVQGDL